MPRSVKEWIASNDDVKIPDRVRQRVFEAHDRKCAECGNPIVPGDGVDYDHKVPLADGGEHRETNLRPLHRSCHRLKSAREANARAQSRATVAKTFGLKGQPQTALSGSRVKYSRARGCWVDRRTGEIVEMER